MKCPGCSAEVADGTSICPSCDYIIDDSFLGASPAPAEPPGHGDTNPGVRRPTPPPTRSGKTRKPARKPRPANGAAREPRGPAPLPPPPPPVATPMPTRFAPESPGARAPSYSPVFRPEEMVDDARLFLGGLTTADKLTLAGGGLIALCSFFPWKETAADGEVIGLQSLGVVATGLTVLAMAALLGRARRSLWINPALAWLLQLACTGATVVWSVVFIKLSSDPTLAHSVDGNMMVPVSRPAMGAYLGVVGGIISAAGTLMGLKDSRP